jgi:hypothetical protein
VGEDKGEGEGEAILVSPLFIMGPRAIDTVRRGCYVFEQDLRALKVKARIFS